MKKEVKIITDDGEITRYIKMEVEYSYNKIIVITSTVLWLCVLLWFLFEV